MGVDRRDGRLRIWAPVGLLWVLACDRDAISPAGEGDRPEAMLVAIRDTLVQENPLLFWESLPPSYRSDVHELVQGFAGEMDAEVWNRGSAVAGKAVRVLSNRKELLFQNPMLHQAIPSDRADFDLAWERTIRLLSQLLESDLGTIEGVRQLNLDEFLRNTGEELVGFITSLTDLFPGNSGLAYSDALRKLEHARISILNHDAHNATVRVDPPGEAPEDFAVVRREGKWVLRELADNWNVRIAEARIVMARFRIQPEERQRALGKLAQIDSILDQLLAAANGSEFQRNFAKILELASGFSRP